MEFMIVVPVRRGSVQTHKIPTIDQRHMAVTKEKIESLPVPEGLRFICRRI
jgi:hypothetical protein